MNSGSINPFNIPQYISICTNLQTAYAHLAKAVSQVKVALNQKGYTIGASSRITTRIRVAPKPITLLSAPISS